jgi:hypothetical protein
MLFIDAWQHPPRIKASSEEKPMPKQFRILTVALFTLLAAGSTAPAHAQIGGILKKAAGKVGTDAVENLYNKPPITTSLEHARWAVDSLDNFTPRESVRSMMQLQRTPNGGFVMQPGYFEMHTQSYCLKAGTHGPGGGDGYIFAPPVGPAEDAVMTIVRNSVNHPEIHQHDVQVLLWAIIARAKFENLDTKLKATAAQLLTPRQLAMLNRNALDMLPGTAFDNLLERIPEPIKTIVKAEGQLRQMMQDGVGFDDMERVAVLAGMPGIGKGSLAVPPGRWSLHPDGYYVRYLPEGYSHTLTQIWVPQGSPAVGKEYDPATHIAVPGNTARQRLIQSGRVYGTD